MFIYATEICLHLSGIFWLKNSEDFPENPDVKALVKALTAQLANSISLRSFYIVRKISFGS